MKQISSILTLSLCLTVACCSPGKKVTYDIPANYPEGRRQQLIELFGKGKELFRNNCAQCHGIFNKGQDSIPDFSEIQFDNYSAKFMAGDPLNHAVARKMSPEQLNQVLMFLRFRKKSGKEHPQAAK